MVSKHSFIKGAVILGAAGAISKVLGAVYRIPLARLLGGEGMGLYQMAYPIYTTILALATAGIPVAISILIARKKTAGVDGDSRRILRISVILLSLIGLVLSGIVFFASGFAARSILMQPKAALAIAAIAPAIFFASLLSVFRGYFQGHQWMVPTAVSQVVEQIFRVTFVLVFAFVLYSRGLEIAAAGATFGAVVGAMAGLVVLIGFYIWFRNKETDAVVQVNVSRESSWELGKELFRLAIPVSLGAIVVPLVQVLDAVIVPSRLIATGFSVTRATELYGELSGMASVLINLPTIFTIAIATSLVPAIAEALARLDKESLKEKIHGGMRLSLLIALPSAAGLFVLAEPIMDLLFDVPEAGIPLAYLAFSVIVLSIFQITSAALQGIGHPGLPLRNLIITGLLKVVFNYYLTGLLFLNIKGPAIATTLAFLVGSGLNMIQLKNKTGIGYEWGRYLKLLVLTFIMGGAAKVGFQALLVWGMTSHLATLAAICIGMLVYVIGLFITGEMDIKLVKKLLRIS